MIFKIYKMNRANPETSCNPVSLFTGFHDFQDLQDEPANPVTSCNPVSLFTGFHDFQGLQDESC